MCRTKLLKNTAFALENAYDYLLGFALYVDWDTYRPTFAVRKVYLEDATLTTIPMRFIDDWNLAVRSVPSAKRSW
jgi:hypothetical protein